MDQDIRNAMTRSLVATPEGRAHLLSLAVDAEEGDEAGIFEQLESLIDDPRLARLAVRHRDDETRHARMYRDCLTRLGLEEQPVPPELKLIRRIAGGDAFADVRLTGAEIAGTYALLYVIEQRGVEQFPLIAEAFDSVDPETAATYRAVTKDEQRHVRYCETIGRRYAGSDAAWEGLVSAARALERSAFAAHGEAQLAYALAHNLVTLAAPAAAAA